jgi:hypothetical protein
MVLLLLLRQLAHAAAAAAGLAVDAALPADALQQGWQTPAVPAWLRALPERLSAALCRWCQSLLQSSPCLSPSCSHCHHPQQHYLQCLLLLMLPLLSIAAECCV